MQEGVTDKRSVHRGAHLSFAAQMTTNPQEEHRESCRCNDPCTQDYHKVFVIPNIRLISLSSNLNVCCIFIL